MAFVDDDEVEEIRWIIAKVWRRNAVFRRTAHEGLKDSEKNARVSRDSALFVDRVRTDPGQGTVGERVERHEVVVGLIGQVVAVREKQDARIV